MKKTAFTCAEMRAIDRRCAEEFGIPVEKLMENAGRAVAEEAGRRLGDPRGKRIAVFCGGGNNGGDGFVAARRLHQTGADALVLLLKPASALKGAPLEQFKKMTAAGIPPLEPPKPTAMRKTAERADLIIDALLGTGFQGPVKEPFAQAIEALNASGRPILAVDVPSGMDADTGRPQGACVRANWTVTLGAMKIGFLNPEASAWTGETLVADIGIPKELLGDHARPVRHDRGDSDF